jgi:alpha-N-arabinofuranosidase
MLEGYDNGSWWDWKDTLGPLQNRPGFQGVWGYQQTHGLGLMEYLEWAEDMNLEIGENTAFPLRTCLRWFLI